MNLKHNSKEFIKANIWYAQDNTTARIYSKDICEHIEDLADRDDAFNEAVEYVTVFLTNYEIGEYEKNGGNGCSQTFNRIINK